MAIIRWNRRHPYYWPSILDEDFGWPELSDSTDMNIYETDESVIVEASVPGIPEEDVDVTVEGNVLTISANYEETDEEKEKKKTIYKSSRKTSFNYSTSLPRMVDSSQAIAEVENGVVKVTVPKSEEELPKKITIKKKNDK